MSACGRKFVFSDKAASNATEAAEKCCQLDMTLAYFPTYADLDCFFKADTALGKSKYNAMVYILGGTNVGCGPMMSWCPINQPIEYFDWNQIVDHAPETHNCVGIYAPGTG